MPEPGPQHPRVWHCSCGCANGWWRSACFRCDRTVTEPVTPDYSGSGAGTPSGERPARRAGPGPGSATVSNDPPVSTPAVPPATPIPAPAQGAATLVAGDAGGPSQQAEGATVDPPPAPPAAGLEQVPA